MKTTQEARDEARLRRLARKYDLSVEKARTRNPDDPNFGQYRIINLAINGYWAGGYPWAYSLNLEEVALALEDDEPAEPPAQASNVVHLR